MSYDADSQPRPPAAAQEAELGLWRAKALERMPYFAPILFSLRVLDAPGLGTFAVDAVHRLYIDFAEVAEWSALENSEALLHECGHLFRDHAARADAKNVRDEELTAWNIAADAMLNLDLVQAGCRTLGQKGIVRRNSACRRGGAPSGTSTSSGPSSRSAGSIRVRPESPTRVAVPGREPRPRRVRSTGRAPGRPRVPATWNGN